MTFIAIVIAKTVKLWDSFIKVFEKKKPTVVVAPASTTPSSSTSATLAGVAPTTATPMATVPAASTPAPSALALAPIQSAVKSTAPAIATSISKTILDVVQKIFQFIEKHWKLVLIIFGIIIILGAVNEIFSCSVNNKLNSDIKSLQSSESALSTDNAKLTANNLSQQGDITKLEGQLGQSQSTVTKLSDELTATQRSLAASQQDNARLNQLLVASTTDAEGLRNQLSSISGFSGTISTNNKSAKELIDSVSAAIGTALGRNSGTK